ncbi:UTP--glucose-1-phosphate uridylyltransferase GalU [Lysinibacillus capsici]|uniref:UTP--glucose-1-phosphate uridylyltransferase GalU n=1 Tax=Lysinibacillus capsici TaxID=2115968 RepID=UPI0028BF4C0C|nr:UTP--glucose-1-phosphate uridylyltransferase GalU [Lysinibacillus capsici]MED3875800.1 UTP--glucose-1-phosphate uridylyltransferase GalU [Lysinibacillus capsici]WNN76883.1 UTP--glucose-1-phosphate uridylyltransferase GalU [Lysinibacillus capsici]
MKKIRKAIIPAAGLGTRFLPATKAMPKEMLPIVDKPTIQYIVEEAIASGIEDIIIVTGRNKRAIEDHFDNVFELETNLLEKGKIDVLEKVQESANVEIHYIRQKEPLGLGHAIWCARKFIGEEPFAVLLGDDIVKNNEPCLKQLITQYEKIEASVIAVQKVPDEDIHRYGVIDPLDSSESLMKVTRFVEKPVLEDAPSNFAIIGRYVLTPEIFGFLDQKKIGKNGEIQLTDAIESLNNIQDVYAYLFKGQRYDVGEKLGYIETMIDFALDRSDLYEEVKAMLLKKAEELNGYS